MVLLDARDLLLIDPCLDARDCPSAERKFQPFFCAYLPFFFFGFEKEKRSLSSGKGDIITTTTTTTTYNEGHSLIERHVSAANQREAQEK